MPSRYPQYPYTDEKSSDRFVLFFSILKIAAVILAIAVLIYFAFFN